MSKTYSKKEVEQMLILLNVELKKSLLGEDDLYSWDKFLPEEILVNGPPAFEPLGIHQVLLTRILTLVKATVDKEKIEPTKDLIKTFFDESKERYHKITNARLMNCFNSANSVIDSYYDYIKKLLHE